jgi:hypothetical protein
LPSKSEAANAESVSVQQALLQVWNECAQEYHKEQLILSGVVKSDSEPLVLFADWLQYNGKWSSPEQQAKDFLKEQQEQN